MNTFRTCITFGLLLLLCAAATNAEAFGPGPLVWSECPPGQPGNDCTRLYLPLDPIAPSKGDDITCFIRRFYSGQVRLAVAVAAVCSIC